MPKTKQLAAIKEALQKAYKLQSRGTLIQEALGGLMVLHFALPDDPEHKRYVLIKDIDRKVHISADVVKVVTTATLNGVDMVTDPMACLAAYFTGRPLASKQLQGTFGPRYQMMAIIPFNPFEDIGIYVKDPDAG